MTDFTLFICGIVVTLIAGMGVITSEVFVGYSKFKERTQDTSLAYKKLQEGLMTKINKEKEKAIKYKHKIELENKVLKEA